MSSRICSISNLRCPPAHGYPFSLKSDCWVWHAAPPITRYGGQWADPPRYWINWLGSVRTISGFPW
jgi:hypothetical protein